MANRHKDSVDNDDLDSFKLRWNVTGSTVSIQASGGRGGRACVRMRDDSSAERTLPSHDEYHFGFPFIPETLPANTRVFARLTDGLGNVHLSLSLTSSGFFVIRTSSGTVLWTSATSVLPFSENYIEWSGKIHASAGTTALYFNGSSTPDAPVYTGVTKNGASGAGSTIRSFKWGGDGAGFYWRWHDYYANDGSGSAPDNTRWGDTVVEDDPCDGTGTYDSLTKSGAATAHECLGDTPGDDGDTTRVYGVSGATTLTFPPLSVPALNVRGVDYEAVARRTDGTDRTLANRTISGSTEEDSTPVSLGTSYQSIIFSYPTDPDTDAAWLQAAVEATEAGPVIA